MSNTPTVDVPTDDIVEAGEVILEGAGEVVDGVVQMARGFSGLALSGAFVAGTAAGIAAGYFVCKRKLEAKYNQLATEAADEISEMRKHYESKAIAHEAAVDKPKLEELVRDNGYSPEPSEPPMAVTPPTAVTERAQKIAEEDDEPDVKAEPKPEVRNVFRDNAPPEDNWDYEKEKRGRSPVRPYVIHIDEREEMSAYDGVTYTYYDADDVLCNERDDVIDAADRERLVGEKNLERFGHGSGDANCVYIRNDQMQMVFEVIRSPNSFAQEVHGFSPEEPEIRHTDRRMGREPLDDE